MLNSSLFIIVVIIFSYGCRKDAPYVKKEMSEEEKRSIIVKNQIKRFQKFRIETINEFGVLRYDSLLLEEEIYNNDGIKVSHLRFGYNKNKVATKSVFEFNKNGTLKYKSDSTGNVTKIDHPIPQAQISFGGNKYKIYTSKYETFFNNNGREKRSTAKFDDYFFQGENQWVNDTIDIRKWYDPNGILESYTKTIKDSKGNILLEYDLLNKSKVITKNRFQYDTNERITLREFRTSSGGNLCVRTEYFYEGVNLIEQRFYECGGGTMDENWVMTGRSTSQYDYRNNEVEFISYDSDGTEKEKYRYQYRYDHTGNILKKNTFLNGKQIEIVCNTYDKKGNLIHSIKEDMEQNKNIVTNFSYHPSGFIAKEITKENGIEKVIVHQYY
ncbi:MAG: hypothetical protein KA285_02540 [Bacteroidia bacterium]|nr:hypothetical protein [Bacteroidia bacterium]